MNKMVHVLGVLFLFTALVNAQQEKGITGSTNWLNNWSEFKPAKKEYGEANSVLSGTISNNTRLEKKNVYLLQGTVYVTNNATLTIDPGTVILCDAGYNASLVITNGACIIAEGLETDPIVFTSNSTLKKAGDWGGIIILGDAPINKFGGVSSVILDLNPALTTYGGNNSKSGSGILKFVRIEFAGAKLKGTENFTSLLLCGVGSNTIVENVMVSYSASDSFGILGGEVALSKLISFKSNSNDYKFNYGTQCTIDNSLAIRSSYLSNILGSRSLDISSYNTQQEVDFSKRQTKVIASNLTIINNSSNIGLDVDSGLIKEAIFVRENTAFECRKTVVSGFNPAVLLDSKIQRNENNLSKIKFEHMYFNFCKGNIFSEGVSNNEDLENYYGNSAFFNVYGKSSNKETFINFETDKKPDFRLLIGKIVASGNDK